MSNTEKKLDALIDALGFDVEQINVNPRKNDRFPSEPIYDYKLTDRGVKTTKGVSDYLRECFDGNNKPPVTRTHAPTATELSMMEANKTANSLIRHKVDLAFWTDENERHYEYMAKIKKLVMESVLPKSILLDLIETCYE
tara:strand:- start:219 stop:638 length:420 start_codon:yes stop_codon:yes gene_type:complete